MLTNRLRPQLIAGLFAPLVIFALVQCLFAHQNAASTAQAVTDRILLASARSIAENVSFVDGHLEATVPPSALGLFDFGYGDVAYYRVARRDGRLLAGYIDLPLPPTLPPASQPAYYDASYDGAPVRLVAFAEARPAPVGGDVATVVVAETLNGRNAMVDGLWAESVRQLFLLVSAACVLGYFGLRRVLAPLVQLSDEVRRREPRDYTPFAVAALQADLAPLVGALNGYMHRLQQQLGAQRRFTENAAHQMRTPLALLRTQATYALRTASDTERTEATHAILATTRQITRLTNQLLSLAKADPNGQTARREAVDIIALAREILEEYGRLAVDRDVDLAFEITTKLPVVTLADRSAIHELIVNLVDNALRYTPAGGHVLATVGRDATHAVLRIEDTGPGVPMNERGRVFERFYRVPGRDVEGSGLGLAIVKEIADAHGATISLGDGPHGGLCVDVRFPAFTDADASRVDVGERGWSPPQQPILGPR